jgi:hypothetical protein
MLNRSMNSNSAPVRGVGRVFVPLDSDRRSLCGCLPEKRAMFLVRVLGKTYKLCAQCAAAFQTGGEV